MYQLAAATYVAGDITSSRRHTLEAIVSARRCGDRKLEADALSSLGRIDRQVCRWSASAEWLEEAVDASEEIGDRHTAMMARQGLAVTRWKQGRLATAMGMVDLCLADSIALQSDLWNWYATLLKGMIQLQQGEVSIARLLFQREDDWAVPRENSRPSLLTSEFLGDIYLEQEQAEPALKLYDEVLPKALALVPKGDIVAELRRRRAECFLLLGRDDEAYAEAQLGLSHCRELGDRYEEAATYRVAALAAAARGNAREARALFEQGFAFYDDIETPFEWGKLWMSYGDWLRSPRALEFQDLRGALEAYVVAREHFDHMGARAKLAMVNDRFAAVSNEISAMEDGSLGAFVGPAQATPPAARRSVRSPRGRRELELDQRSQWAFDTFGMVTRNQPLLATLANLEKLARSTLPLLVLGESGTGKELVARAAHRLSGRKGAYMAINCSAIARDLVESELFGHVAGAFSGATRDKPGLFEVCDGGSTFLDEIGELELDLQSKLLRFLEAGESRRVGATRNYEANVRTIAATNRDRGAMEKGEGFRSDLYYRLAHAVIELPPLRVRGEDIVLLADRFVALANAREKKDTVLSDAALDKLGAYSWPGNVRQLRGLIEHAVILAEPGATIGPDAFDIAEEREAGSFDREMELVEKRRMEEALRQHNGSKAEAARALRMPRTTFLARMRRYGMR